MGAANKDSQKDVAQSVWVEEQSSHAAKRKFETRSDLTERAGIDTVLVPAGKTPRAFGEGCGWPVWGTGHANGGVCECFFSIRKESSDEQAWSVPG